MLNQIICKIKENKHIKNFLLGGAIGLLSIVGGSSLINIKYPFGVIIFVVCIISLGVLAGKFEKRK